MRVTSVAFWWGCCAVGGLLLAAVNGARGDAPAPPPVSQVLPADELLKLVDYFAAELRGSLADEAAYAEKSGRMTRDAHTLAVVALALAQHDQEHRLKASSASLLAAARQLSATGDYASAKGALAHVEAAVGGEATTGEPVRWEKVAPMGPLMKQVGFANTRLKSNLRRFEQRAEENARSAAILAVIAQSVTFDTHEVKNKADAPKWHQMCDEMRDAASALSAQVRAGDKPAAEAAFARLAKSCDDCHAVFRQP